MYLEQSTNPHTVRRPRGVALAAVLLLAVIAGRSFGQCQYSVQSWPWWQCGWGSQYQYTGTGLNDLGAWCGYRHGCFPEDAFNWYPVYCPPGGLPQVLPIPDGASEDGARATAVNNAGIVVGYMSVGSSSQYQQGVIWWPDGSWELIPPVAGSMNSRANGINDLGVIVGSSGGLPYVLERGVMTTIRSPGLGGGRATSSSESGYVIGNFGSMAGGRGFRWHEGLLEILPPLGDHAASEARGVHPNGLVVGISRTLVGSAYIASPTVWTGTVAEGLPLAPGFDQGVCVGVNESGVIIGINFRLMPEGGTQTTRVVWVGREVFPLDALIVPGSPSVGETVAINDAGQILAGGGPRLLTPTSWSPVDLNGDCAVNGDDLGVLLSSWGIPDFDPRCDFNGDGAVDGDDLGTLLGEWSLSR